ncbi:glycoside hydrolase [Exidia glandulosa HHB12029]|uniref:chitinase n=1 Tax=Exidia glandulosa HHB12029 TaxID=1314781 RepID=A0A165PDT6_EXIGL|nr:glycoside hydrolase [Exidia glandulosa HHB12029]
MVASRALSAAVLAAVLPLSTVAFDNSRADNFVAYWGQNSYGAAHSDDQANWQKNISYYCEDDSIDVFPVSFLLTYFGKGDLPVINLAGTCNDKDNQKFDGSDLLDCSFMSEEIKKCQAKGKAVTISMGGATGANTFGSDEQAKGFADQVWDLFLGGDSKTRPFGDAVLDGVDLDIEGGGPTGYAAFVTQLRTHFDNADKKYYVTAAPQCIFPDQNLGAVLDAAYFDAVYVQFYNNPCGLNKADDPVNWNFGVWDWWARNTSPNKDVKIYLGAPASSTAAGSGFLEADALSKVATDMRKKYPSFGGVMVWDASQAYANGRFDQALKKTMKANGGTGFQYPACDAAEWASGNNYQGGDLVTYKGSIWRAKWSAGDEPKASDLGAWVPVSACGTGGEAPSEPSTADPVPSSTAAPTSTEAPSETEAPTTSTAPVPPTTSAEPEPLPTTTSSSEPAPTETEDPCPPESTAAPVPTTVPGGGGGGATSDPTPTPTETEDPCPPEETSQAPVPTEDPCPPEEPTTTQPTGPVETEDPCPPEDSTTPVPPAPTGNTGGSGGSCGSAKAWTATDTYVGGDTVSSGGHIYKAKWWTQNEQPGKAEVWEDAGACSGKRAIEASARPTPVARYAPHLKLRPTPHARFAPHVRRRRF